MIFNRRSTSHGFSLIELIVVVSIISLLAALVNVPLTRYKIKAAQLEMQQYVRSIYQLAVAYHAETGKYYSNATTGFFSGSAYAMNRNWVYCDPNDLGFRVGDCLKLRYRYDYDSTGGEGNAVDLTKETRFTILAQSIYTVRNSGMISKLGNNHPTHRCKPNDGFKVTYSDSWTMFEDGILQPHNNDSNNNALNNCF